MCLYAYQKADNKSVPDHPELGTSQDPAQWVYVYVSTSPEKSVSVYRLPVSLYAYAFCF